MVRRAPARGHAGRLRHLGRGPLDRRRGTSATYRPRLLCEPRRARSERDSRAPAPHWSGCPSLRGCHRTARDRVSSVGNAGKDGRPPVRRLRRQRAQSSGRSGLRGERRPRHAEVAARVRNRHSPRATALAGATDTSEPSAALLRRGRRPGGKSESTWVRSFSPAGVSGRKSQTRRRVSGARPIAYRAGASRLRDRGIPCGV